MVNGEVICMDDTPPGCGYVNGIYGCTGESGFTESTPTAGEDELSKPGPYDAAARDASQWMAGWFNSWSEGEQGPMGRALNWAVKKAVTWWYEVKLSALKRGWTLAKGLLQDLNVFGALASAWNAIPGDALAFLTFLGIPQALNIIINAVVTKFVLRFVPGA